MSATIRPMETRDLEGVAEQLFATKAEAERRHGRTMEPAAEDRRRTDSRLQYQLSTDPEGCWVADAGAGEIVGHTIALRRGHIWGLSMLHIHPQWQSKGLGRRLLAVALSYARDADAGIITSSADPRAMRLYATSGFALRPAVEATGKVHRPALRATPSVRDGRPDDLELTVVVDEAIRGAAHGDGGADIAALVRAGGRLSVLDDSTGQGYVVVRDDALLLLAATTPAAAQELLWHGLASLDEGKEACIGGLTGAQQWAIEVVYAASLTVKPDGPVLTRGRLGPMTPYLPSGAYL